MLCCYCLPPGLLHVLGAFGSLSQSHISPLNRYEIVCEGDLACTFSQMKSMNIFSVYLQSGVPRHFLWIYCDLNIELHCFHVYTCQCWPQTLSAVCRNMDICDVFTLCPLGKIYKGFRWVTVSWINSWGASHGTDLVCWWYSVSVPKKRLRLWHQMASSNFCLNQSRFQGSLSK